MVAAAAGAGQEHRAGIEHRRGERQEGVEVEIPGGGAEDQHHAEEADDHRRPTGGGDPVADEQGREQGDEDRQGVIGRGRRRERQFGQREVVEHPHRHQHPAAQRYPADPPGAAQGRGRGHREKDDEQREHDQRAEHEDLPEHEAAAGLFDKRIAERQRQNGHHDGAHGEGDVVGLPAVRFGSRHPCCPPSPAASAGRCLGQQAGENNAGPGAGRQHARGTRRAGRARCVGYRTPAPARRQRKTPADQGFDRRLSGHCVAYRTRLRHSVTFCFVI